VLGPKDFLHVVMLGDSWLFEAWLLLGGVLAAPVFASVVAIPMLLDRDESAAGGHADTSWRVVMDPAPMALWAGMIMGLTALGMATALTGA
jgi:uncharacterized membrane protein